jgi:DNA-binding transcriptional LysR family regulator
MELRQLEYFVAVAEEERLSVAGLLVKPAV